MRRRHSLYGGSANFQPALQRFRTEGDRAMILPSRFINMAVPVNLFHRERALVTEGFFTGTVLVKLADGQGGLTTLLLLAVADGVVVTTGLVIEEVVAAK